ncbi:MAG: hypothetical protein IKZ29_09230 [Clostridiales bacterium]|nr:hypothetical protein [Clostridiales bacterium]
MKNTKVIACVLSAAMIAGVFSGCSGKKVTNITTEQFTKACDKTLKLDEVDIEDIYDLDEGDLEDGIYLSLEQEDIEDMGIGDYLDMYLKSFDLDDIFEAEDIESVAVAAKMTDPSDVEDIEDPEDLEDLELEGVYAIQLTLADDDLAADIMEFLADKLDEADLDVKKDLSKAEYYAGKKDGCLKLHVDVAKLVKTVLDNDDFQDALEDSDNEDDIVEALESLKGDAVVTIEVSGANILIMVGYGLNTEASMYKDFVKAFGASDATKLPHNEKVSEAAVDAMVDAVAMYIERAKSAAYSWDDDWDI